MSINIADVETQFEKFYNVATQFAKFYYETFDKNRPNLRPLYRDDSMLTWEGNLCVGVGKIMDKLTNLPFQTITRKVSTVDCQPSYLPIPQPQPLQPPPPPREPNIFVTVTGLIHIDDAPQMQFQQSFLLVAEGDTYYVANDIFRLNLA